MTIARSYPRSCCSKGRATWTRRTMRRPPARTVGSKRQYVVRPGLLDARHLLRRRNAQHATRGDPGRGDRCGAERSVYGGHGSEGRHLLGASNVTEGCCGLLGHPARRRLCCVQLDRRKRTVRLGWTRCRHPVSYSRENRTRSTQPLRVEDGRGTYIGASAPCERSLSIQW